MVLIVLFVDFVYLEMAYSRCYCKDRNRSPIVYLNDDGTEPENNIPCPSCKCMFSSDSDVEKHAKRVHQCKPCGDSLASQEETKKHQRHHKQEKQLQKLADQSAQKRRDDRELEELAEQRRNN